MARNTVKKILLEMLAEEMEEWIAIMETCEKKQDPNPYRNDDWLNRSFNTSDVIRCRKNALQFSGVCRKS